MLVFDCKVQYHDCKSIKCECGCEASGNRWHTPPAPRRDEALALCRSDKPVQVVGDASDGTLRILPASQRIDRAHSDCGADSAQRVDAHRHHNRPSTTHKSQHRNHLEHISKQSSLGRYFRKNQHANKNNKLPEKSLKTAWQRGQRKLRMFSRIWLTYMAKAASAAIWPLINCSCCCNALALSALCCCSSALINLFSCTRLNLFK